jgi:hypothetical protein
MTNKTQLPSLIDRYIFLFLLIKLIEGKGSMDVYCEYYLMYGSITKF